MMRTCFKSVSVIRAGKSVIVNNISTCMCVYYLLYPDVIITTIR